MKNENNQQVEWSNDNSVNEQPVFWEDLIALKDQTVEILLNQQQLTAEFCKMAADNIAKNKELSDKVKGLLNSYKHIADAIAGTMRLHITMDENNVIVDYKKGQLETDTDDYIDYVRIVSNYVHAQEQVADLSFNSYADLLTIIKTNEGIDVDNEINLLAKTYIDGKKDILTIQQDVIKKMEEDENNGK